MRRKRMHEVSIALGMIDELEKIARENRATKILRVNLKIGRLSGIVTDSLMFAFEAMKHEHPLLSSAKIVIAEIPLVYKCNECNQTFDTENIYFPACPRCVSYNLNIISGEEQHIENVEVEV
jgi:hydrogenase nickel incorporation protein HypA/HybF